MSSEPTSSQQDWMNAPAGRVFRILRDAVKHRRPTVFLLGAGVSAGSGFPLASQIGSYLVQVHAWARLKRFAPVRDLVDEMKWPSRHDLRLEMLRLLDSRDGEISPRSTCTLRRHEPSWERIASQDAMISEIIRLSPSLARSMQDVLNIDPDRGHWKRVELEKLYKAQLGALQEKFAARIPPFVGYRSLLFHLCDNDQNRIDACFDHFRRDREPTTTHQLLVFLSRVLGTRVFLTTNFDTMVEEALQLEGLVPTVYDLQGPAGLPSAQMLLSQPVAVVKLHGGSHHLRTGFDLDEPVGPAVLSTFYEFYDRLEDEYGAEPLTVVIGNSGSDRRIIEIIASQLRRWRRGKHERVLWITRGLPAPQLLIDAANGCPELRAPAQGTTSGSGYRTFQEDMGKDQKPDRRALQVCSYRDARLFFLEMHNGLAGHFPTARSQYQCILPNQESPAPNEVKQRLALQMHDRRVEGITVKGAADHICGELTAEPEGNDVPTRVLGLRGPADPFLSTVASNLAAALERKGFELVWIDLTEVGSVSAVLDVVSEKLCKLDARLQGLRRPLFMSDLLQAWATMLDKQDLDSLIERDVQIAVQWLRHALRRDRYCLVIDSIHEFPNCHPADVGHRPATVKAPGRPDTPEPLERWRDAQRAYLVKVLQRLSEHAHLLGDSVVVLVEAETESDSPSVHQHVFGEPRSGCLQAGVSCDAEATETPSAEGESLRAPLELSACCNRRARSEVFLTRAVTEFRALVGMSWSWREPTGLSGAVQAIEQALSNHEEHASRGDRPSNEREQVLKALRGYAATSRGSGVALERREGGYHHMARGVRDEMYKQRRWMRDSERDKAQNSLLAVMLMHHVHAFVCCDELYDRSRDARALSEYIFQRVASIQCAAQAEKWGLAVGWIERLAATLTRERSALLAHARLPTLLVQLRDAIVAIERAIGRAAAACEAELARRALEPLHAILDVLANVLENSGHPHQALQCRYAIAHSQAASGGGHPPEDFALNLSAPSSDPEERASGVYLLDEMRTYMNPLVYTKTSLKVISRLGVAPTTKQVERVLMPNLQWPASYAGRRSRVSKICGNAPGTQASCVWRAFEVLRQTARTKLQSQYSSVPVQMREYREAITNAAKVENRRREIDMLRRGVTIVPWVSTIVLHVHPMPPMVGVDESKNPSEAERKISECLSTIKGRFEHIERLCGKHPLPSEGSALVDNELPEEGEPVKRVGQDCRRYECYRLCQAGQIRGATAMRELLEAPGGAKATVLLSRQFAQSWEAVTGRFEEAEAVLNRRGADEADAQALAVTRALWAESFVRQGELRVTELAWFDYALRIKRRQDSITLGQARDDCNRQCRALLGKASALLAPLAKQLRLGRFENRWSSFYQMVLCRHHLLQARLNASASGPQWRTEGLLFDAARPLIGALTNTGVYTDRHMLLRWWWLAWKTGCGEILRSRGTIERDVKEFIADTRARLGVNWGSEQSVGGRTDTRRSTSASGAGPT